jgi:hypothetical protein
MKLHMPMAGQFCVPAAVEIITGHDPLSVIIPAFNRHGQRDTLLEPGAAENMETARKVLEELGWVVRRHKGNKLNALVRDWAQRFPGHVILIAAGGHCMVLHDGKVFDSWEPAGKAAILHPFHNARVYWAALIQK